MGFGENNSGKAVFRKQICRGFKKRFQNQGQVIRHRPEQLLQEWLARLLDSKGVLYCASAGGMRTSMQTAIRMKRAGYKKGFPDIFIYEPRGLYNGMSIELKAGSMPTKEQLEWKMQLGVRGYYSVIVPAKLNHFEAIEFLEKEVNNYLGLHGSLSASGSL